MKKIALIAALSLCVGGGALAQTQIDTDKAQRAIAVLQHQRNQALDAAATSEVELMSLRAEVKRLQDELEALKKQPKTDEKSKP